MDGVITVVMPYWERYKAAHDTMVSFDKKYGEDVKVIIVDDGSPTQPAKRLEREFGRVTVLELPIKQGCKNPCSPFNLGAALVKTKYIGLSNPETIHLGPSLYEMVELIEGWKDYILAPAWCPEMKQWHCHPDLHIPDIPEGTGFHHMGLMTKKLWCAVGGMDDEYRDGYCFDDTDFVMRLVSEGANFIYSEMPVVHVRTGAKAPIDIDGWNRNHALYQKKWRHINGHVNV